MTKAYVARKTINFCDDTVHLEGHTYFSTEESQAYFDVMAKDYEEIEVKTVDINGRVIAVVNHPSGYTKSYLSGWMKATGYYDFDAFSVWMSGQTVGVNDNNETVYYYHDVFRYICKGGALAKVED